MHTPWHPMRRWVNLRRKPASERRVAVLLYGFPPGVGATGTAALLNVPKSLEAVLGALRGAGYDLGPQLTPGLHTARGAAVWHAGGAPDHALPDHAAAAVDGEALVTALKGLEDGRVVAGGARGVEQAGAGPAAAFGAAAVGAEVTPAQLKQMLAFPKDWGPTEWGEARPRGRSRPRHGRRATPRCSPAWPGNRPATRTLACSPPTCPPPALAPTRPNPLPA